jgi:hypothetical protein
VSGLVLPHSIDANSEILSTEHQANYVAIRDKISGNINTDNIAANQITPDLLEAALAVRLGVSQAGVVRRGSSVIATEEQRTSTSFGLHPTPDRVQNVVLATTGLIYVSFIAEVKCTVADVTSASIFIGANQIKAASTAAAPAVVGIATGAGPQVKTVYNALTAHPVFGLVSGNSGTAYTGNVTTGQSAALFSAAGDGGAWWVGFAAAGTYDVSIQTKSSSGIVFLKNRTLLVKTESY